MEGNNVCYLERMPDEILLKIFRNLESIDILSISSVSRNFERISYSTELSRKLDFQLEYNFNPIHVEKFLSKKPMASLIISLNINCLYWLDPSVLRQLIVKMEALEELYILDTKLGVSMEDIDAYSKLPKLNKIALTIRGEDEISLDALAKFPNVTHLFLHGSQLDTNNSATKLIHQLQTLEILILADTQPAGYIVPFSLDCETLPKSLRSITCYDYNLNDNFLYIEEYCNSIKSYRLKQVTFEKLGEEQYSKSEEVNPTQNMTYSKIARMIQDINIDPFSISDHRKLQMRSESQKDICYEELNFTHHCTERIEIFNAMLYTLLSKNTVKLKKLGIRECLIKKAPNILKNISEQCRYLEELKVWSICFCHYSPLDNNMLNDIKFMKNLRQLTLNELNFTWSGKYLVEIIQGCEHLSTLRIGYLQSPNIEVIKSICSALHQAQSLVNLRLGAGYEDIFDTIPIDEVLDLLPRKLQTICLDFDDTILPSEDFLHTFLNERKQLKFLCIISICCKHLIRWEKADKVIVVDKRYKNIFPKIPLAYTHIVQKFNEPSVFDLFNFNWA